MPAQDEVALFAERLNAVGAQYMITGATAAILYGQPRTTNDIDVVMALDDIEPLLKAFPEAVFYLPPVEVIRSAIERSRGHFNIIHIDSGFKADVYTPSDPLHAWALPLRRLIAWEEGLALPVAPPEYVILRKLEYFREGGSDKHRIDIQNILAITPVDRAVIEDWVSRLGLAETWQLISRQ